MNLVYSKRSEKKFYAILARMIIATITYSDTTKMWYVNFQSISQDVWELKTKQECDQIIRKQCEDFLKECYE